MNDTSINGTTNPRVYIRQGHSRWKTIGYFWAGVGWIAVAVVGFFIAIKRPHTDMIQLQLMCNVPALLGFGCLAAAYFSRGSPEAVHLFDDRIELVYGSAKRAWTMEELSLAPIALTAMTRRRKMKLYNRAGRRVATISDDLDGFDELVDELQRRLAARQDDQVETVRMKKARRQAILLGAFSFVMAGVVAFLIISDRADAKAERLLREQGHPAVASVIRLFTAPNGVTRRIEYQVRDASGTVATHNAEIDPAIWKLLRGSKTVDVLAVPGRPDVARMTLGEVKDDSDLSPGMKHLLWAAGGVMCLLFLVGAILNWRGIDIDLDSKTGKISIKRFGGGR